MQCKTLHKNLIFFLEGELPSEKKLKIEEHLSECPECAAFVSEMKKTLAIIEVEKATEQNPFFYTRVKAKRENQESRVSQPRNTVLVRVLQPALFSIVLLLGIYAGIKIGEPGSSVVADNNITESEIIPFLNELNNEPIEAFLME